MMSRWLCSLILCYQSYCYGPSTSNMLCRGCTSWRTILMSEGGSSCSGNLASIEAYEEVSRVRHELQLLQQQVTDKLNTQAEHLTVNWCAEVRGWEIQRAKAESDRSLKAEINRLSSRQTLRWVRWQGHHSLPGESKRRGEWWCTLIGT